MIVQYFRSNSTNPDKKVQTQPILFQIHLCYSLDMEKESKEKGRDRKMKTVVVDIGGTAIKSGVFVYSKVIDLRTRPTRAERGADEVIRTVIEVISGYEDYEAIGISTTGQIHVKEGRVLFAGNNIPGYEGTELKRILEDYFHKPVFVENDVNAAALGEAYFGAGMGVDQFLCLTYGTGIGGGIILNGQLYRGAQYAAGEFGGILVHPKERNESDIFSGCYERYASVSALVNRAKKEDASIDCGKAVIDRIQEPKIDKVVNGWVHEIAIGLVSLIHSFNPSLVLLGGAIMEQSVIVCRVRAEVRHMLMEVYQDVQIRPAMLGNTAGMYGMAHIADCGLHATNQM